MSQNRLMLYLANLSMVIETIGKTRIKRVLILMLFAIPMRAQTTYYVSTTDGNDNNNGTSSSTPWKTIYKVNKMSFNAGDHILLKCGDTLQGEFNSTYNGTASAPIVIDSYGTGAKPVIIGNMYGCTWIPYAGRPGIWKMWIGATSELAGYDKAGNNWVLNNNKMAGNIIFYLNNPDTLKKYLDSFTPGCYGGEVWDTVYYKTIDGLSPAGRFRLYRYENTFRGTYLIVRNLHFEQFQTLDCAVTYSLFYNISTMYFLDHTYLLTRATHYTVMDHCDADSSAATIWFDYFGSHNTYRYSTIKNVVDSVLGLPNTYPERCAVGMQRDTACTVEYVTANGIRDSFFDSGELRYEFPSGNYRFALYDTIRYNTITNSQGGIFMSGNAYACYGNYIYPAPGINVAIYMDTQGAGHSVVHDNTIITSGIGLQAVNQTFGDSGGTSSFYNNTVTGNSKGSFLVQYGIPGITSYNNTFYHTVTITAPFVQGVYPNTTGYSTPTAFYNATGYENSSVFSSNTVALPVQITSFTGAVKGNAITLNWKTATEVNSNIFEIERRITTAWESIGKVPAGGTSNAPREYVYVDNLKNVDKGGIFYRLKSVDNDGSFQYKGDIEVMVTTAIPNMYMLNQNYPNPFNPTTTINYQLQNAGQVSLKVYDMLGREVATLVNGEKEAGYYSAIFDGSKLSSGTYIYRLQTGSFTETKKLVLLK